MRAPNTHRLTLIMLALLLATLQAPALTLYSTAFEEFTAGDDRWVGTNGWQGASTGVGAHGIDQDILPGLGKTAFLGFNRPKQTFVTVFRPILYNPVTNGMPVVEFETLMGIVDSTNGMKDSFFFTFYNSTGNLLAAIRFDNTELNFGIWRLNGTNQTDTGVAFIRSELHLLFASINYSNNVWSADLDGIPLFTNATFNATSQPRDLGFIAAEWQLTGASTNDYGNNWMLVADWAVRTYPDASIPFFIEQMTASTNGSHAVGWTGERGFDYAVQYAERLASWTSGLPNSTFTNIQSTTPLSFSSTTNVPHRFYRIRRTRSP